MRRIDAIVNGKATIVEFAERIGVSPTTVSRSISGRGRISESTRQMVLDRMKEYGYIPNPHAQRMRTGQAGMVLLHATGVDTEFMVAMARSVQKSLWAGGYGLVLDTTSGLTDEDSLLREWLASGAVDGAILMVGLPNIDISELTGLGRPVVAMGYPVPAGLPYVGSVVWSLEDGAKRVADLLVSFGHKRIGFVDIGNGDPVIESFRARLRTHGLELDDSMIVVADGELGLDEGARAIGRMLGSTERPTAVFARNDMLALGAIRQARKMGFRVPEDVSIVGHDDMPQARIAEPLLTTVRVDCFKMGKAAAEMMFALLDGADTPVPKVTIDCTSLIVRDSVALAPDRALVPDSAS